MSAPFWERYTFALVQVLQPFLVKSVTARAMKILRRVLCSRAWLYDTVRTERKIGGAAYRAAEIKEAIRLAA